MSKPTTPRPNSQQKKTGMAIISDPIGFKKPSIAEMRSDVTNGNNNNNSNNNSAFKKPSISDFRGNTPEDDAPFKPPSISAMKESAPPPENFAKPSLADMRTANPPAQEGGFKKPTMADMQDVHVEFKVDPMKEDPHYKPYTVEEYRELQQIDDFNNRGGLGPSYDDEWERKKEMRTRLMKFAQKTKDENKTVIPKRVKPRQEPKKEASKRDKMKEYATKIPKPKVQAKNDKPLPKPKTKPTTAKYDLNAELQRHNHFVQRVNTLRASLSQYLD